MIQLFPIILLRFTLPTSTMTVTSLPPRIDVHSHFLPPDYQTALHENGHERPDGMPGVPPWSLESHLEMMSTANVTKAIISISSPGTHLVYGNDELTRNLTRHCNSYAANLKRTYPDKFGFWASLPLPDVDAALDEIDRAIEEGADGFGGYCCREERDEGDGVTTAEKERREERGKIIRLK